MYRLMIVDDEKMIREGIAKVLPFKELGIGDVFTAGSGLEALRIMETEVPDILITDIRMTEMDGLTLVKRINEANPAMRIIVLTGYDNFEYVQQCCKMEVHDYLLKPVDEEELQETIRKQVKMLQNKEQDRQRQRIMSRAQGITEQLKLEHTMQNLLHGRIRLEEVQELFEEYSVDTGQSIQTALLCPVLNDKEDWKQHFELLNLSIKNVCIELFDSNHQGITFQDDDKNIVLILFTGINFDESVERIEKLNAFLKEEYGIKQRVILGSEVKGFKKLMVSYNDGVALLKDSRKTDLIIQSRDSELRLKLFQDIFRELKKTMENNLGDYDRAMRAFTSYCRATRSYNLSTSLVKKTCFELSAAIYFVYISETGESTDRRLDALLLSLHSGDREDAYHIAEEFMTRILNPGEKQIHGTVTTAKRYIKDHLDEDLSVTKLAEMLYVTPSYFSKLFKNNTKEGCNSYIVRKRMEKAKSLLETTSMKTGRIAAIVGYKDANYFSLAFKKFAGASPLEYRESYLSKN